MIFHTFILHDCEDPDIYAADPIFKWQNTEKGQWVMRHGHALTYDLNTDMNTLGYRVTIRGCLKPEAETYFRLKYQ
jgi:hypothetical protein